jgi:NADH-ubiquinone oxidoreductase chain 2
MIITSILSLLLSASVTLRRDMAILFNRIAILSLTYCIIHDILSISFLSKGVGLHGGLLHISNITQIFHVFVFFVSILILQLTSFYPRKI